MALALAGYRSRNFKVTATKDKKVEIRVNQATLVKEVFSLSVFANPPLPGAKISGYG